MSYKKIALICSVAMIVSATVFSSCSKKNKEEDITITLKTEGAVPAQTSTAQGPSQEKPLTQEKHKTLPIQRETPKEARHEKVGPLPERKTLENNNRTAREQVASNVPHAAPQPSPEDVARQHVLAIINRQKQAMVTKNVSLALQDIAGNSDQNKRALEDYFNRYEKIDVNFSNISINVSGNTAIAVMDQRTSIVTKSLIPQTITELTRVQWTFVEDSNRWLISGTQILSKLKDR